MVDDRSSIIDHRWSIIDHRSSRWSIADNRWSMIDYRSTIDDRWLMTHDRFKQVAEIEFQRRYTPSIQTLQVFQRILKIAKSNLAGAPVCRDASLLFSSLLFLSSGHSSDVVGLPSQNHFRNISSIKSSLLYLFEDAHSWSNIPNALNSSTN